MKMQRTTINIMVYNKDSKIKPSLQNITFQTYRISKLEVDYTTLISFGSKAKMQKNVMQWKFYGVDFVHIKLRSKASYSFYFIASMLFSNSSTVFAKRKTDEIIWDITLQTMILTPPVIWFFHAYGLWNIIFGLLTIKQILKYINYISIISNLS